MAHDPFADLPPELNAEAEPRLVSGAEPRGTPGFYDEDQARLDAVARDRRDRESAERRRRQAYAVRQRLQRGDVAVTGRIGFRAHPRAVEVTWGVYRGLTGDGRAARVEVEAGGRRGEAHVPLERIVIPTRVAKPRDGGAAAGDSAAAPRGLYGGAA